MAKAQTIEKVEKPIPSRVKQVFSVSLVLIIISTVAMLFFGKSVIGINRDIKELSIFLTESQDIQPNFERSLQVYTESTEKIVNYLLELRPDREEDYIKFISSIENLEQTLSIKLNIQSIDEASIGVIESQGKTLHYGISFFGNMESLIKLLKEFEKLPYFISINKIKYKNPNLLTEADKEGNINLLIKLFIK